MVLMLMMSVLVFMTMMIILIMILMMILTMILMMILKMLLMMILTMMGAGIEDRSQEEPYSFPPGCVQISRIWILSGRGKGTCKKR